MILYTSMNRATAQCPFIPESVTFVYFIKMSTYFHTFSPGSPTIQAFSYKTYCLTEYTWRRLQASWRTETTCWWSQPVPPGAPAPTLCGHLLWRFVTQHQSTVPQSGHALFTQAVADTEGEGQGAMPPPPRSPRPNFAIAKVCRIRLFKKNIFNFCVKYLN